MKRLINLIAVLLVLMTCQLLAVEKMVVRITNPTKETILKFNQSNYDVASVKPGEYIDLVVTAEQKKVLSKQYNLTVTQTEQQLSNNLNSAKSITGYRDYEQLLAELQQLVSQHPNLLKIYNIGTSNGKNYALAGDTAYNRYQHDIWAVKLSDNVSAEEDEPGFYFMGEHHAREPIGLEVTMKILHQLVDNYGTNQAMTDRVNNSQIWFIPLVNPNGHKIVLDQTDLWWRKNIRDNNQNHQIDAADYNQGPSEDGVDLNRNYDFEWSLVGASNQFNNHTYHGPNPFSEPELAGIKTLMENHKFVAGISYHSYSELVLYPYGHADGVLAPDELALKTLAEDMAITIPKQNGGTYTPQASWALYPCTGTTDDYSYGKFGTFSYTIEMATEFIPPQADLTTIANNNLQAPFILLDRVKKSTLTGLVKNSQTNQPVIAQISVEEIDNSPVYREPYTSDATFGRYFRLLQPGTFTVKVSAYGYNTQTINGVQITSTGVTNLNVNLVPQQPVAVSGTVTKTITNSPIENAKIEIQNTPVAPSFTNSSGFYQIGQIYPGNYKFIISAANCQTLVQERTVGAAGNSFNFVLSDPEPAWDTLYTQNFEASFPPTGWTNSTPGWTAGTEPNSGSKCAKAVYTPAGTRILTTQAINIGSYDSLRVSFWWKDDDISKINGYDSTWCEYSVNNSTTWIKLAVLSKNSHDGAYSKCTVQLPAGITQPIKFRWRDKTDGSNDAYGTGLDDIVIAKKTLTSINNDQSTINSCRLEKNYPNPFNNTTVVKYQLANSAKIVLSVYNIKGELVKTLFNGIQTSGGHSVSFNADGLNSGVYLLKLTTPDKSAVQKCILIK